MSWAEKDRCPSGSLQAITSLQSKPNQAFYLLPLEGPQLSKSKGIGQEVIFFFYKCSPSLFIPSSVYSLSIHYQAGCARTLFLNIPRYGLYIQFTRRSTVWEEECFGLNKTNRLSRTKELSNIKKKIKEIQEMLFLFLNTQNLHLFVPLWASINIFLICHNIIKGNDNRAKAGDPCITHRHPTGELFTLLNSASHISSISSAQ